MSLAILVSHRAAFTESHRFQLLSKFDVHNGPVSHRSRQGSLSEGHTGSELPLLYYDLAVGQSSRITGIWWRMRL